MLEAFFEPTSIAIIGASRQTGPVGYEVLKNVLESGFKGKRYGDAGVHKNQALVLVNYGAATGKEIVDLAHKIIDTVYAKFNIRILPEVNIV